MSPCLTVQSVAPGAATIAVDIDEDVLLVGVHTTVQAVVSRDQSDTAANVTTVTAQAQSENLIAFLNSSGSFVPLKVPLSEGSRIFVAFKTNGSLFLNFDRPAQP